MNREEQLDRLVEICLDKKFETISRDTVERAWKDYSFSYNEEWVQVHGSEEHAWEQIAPYLPVTRAEAEAEQKERWVVAGKWSLFGTVVFTIGSILAMRNDHQGGILLSVTLVGISIFINWLSLLILSPTTYR